MTKTVRIENADTGTSFKVLVQIWDKGYPEGEPDKMASEQLLSNPTEMATLHITSTRYLVIKEPPAA